MDAIIQKRMEIEKRLKSLEGASSSSNNNNNISHKTLEGEEMPFPLGFDQWSKEKQTSYMAAWLQTKASKPKVYNNNQKREIMLRNNLTGEYFPEVKEQIYFGNIHLKVIPQDCKFAFNTPVIIKKGAEGVG